MGLGSTRTLRFVCHLRTSSHCSVLFILTGHIRLKPLGCGGVKKKVGCSCDTPGGTGVLELLAGAGETDSAGLVGGLPRNVSACVPAQLLSRVQLCDPVDCSPPGSCVHGILQARILEWVAISCSSGTSRPRDQTCLLHLLNWQADSCWATWAAPRNVSSWIQTSYLPWAEEGEFQCLCILARPTKVRILETLASSQGPYELPSIQEDGEYRGQESQHGLAWRRGRPPSSKQVHSHATHVHWYRMQWPCMCTEAWLLGPQP